MNDCETVYHFISTDESVLEDFRARIEKATSSSFMKTIHGNYWLGNVLHEFCPERKLESIYDVDVEDWGTLEYTDDIFEKGDEYVTDVGTITAQTEMPKMWDAIIEDNYPNKIRYVYKAHTPSTGYSATSAKYKKFVRFEYDIIADIPILDMFYNENDPMLIRSDDICKEHDSKSVLSTIRKVVKALKRIECICPDLFKSSVKKTIRTVTLKDVDLLTEQFYEIFSNMDTSAIPREIAKNTELHPFDCYLEIHKL